MARLSALSRRGEERVSLTRPAKQNITRLAVDIDKPWTFIVLMLVLSPKINSYFEFDLGLGLDFGLGLKLVNNIKQGSSGMNEAFSKMVWLSNLSLGRFIDF